MFNGKVWLANTKKKPCWAKLLRKGNIVISEPKRKCDPKLPLKK